MYNDYIIFYTHIYIYTFNIHMISILNLCIYTVYIFTYIRFFSHSCFIILIDLMAKQRGIPASTLKCSTGRDAVGKGICPPKMA